MKELFNSELHRFLKKKSTILCFLIIPAMIVASAKYYLNVDKQMPISSPEFTSFWNFPIAALQEQLVLAINIVAILFIVLSVTQEFRDSSIRMVLIRRFKPTELFISKFLIIAMMLFIYLVAYLLTSYLVGYIFFPKESHLRLFFFAKDSGWREILIYTLKYYFLAYLTLIAVASVIFLVATISKSVIISVGTSVGVLIFLISYPTVIQFLAFFNPSIDLYKFISITQIQFEGIARMLGENPSFLVFNLATIFIYILGFGSLSYLLYKKKDNLI